MARPKEFDRDDALDRAMEIFWTRGFEATSVGDLVEGIGIGRQSLYDTFGDKHALYLAALDRYRDRYGAGAAEAVNGAVPVRRAFRAFLQAVIDSTLANPEKSCMMVSAAAERCPRDAEVGRRFCASSAGMERAFKARLERARDEGEIAAHHDVTALARFFVNAFLGLQLSAKGGTDRRALEQVADVTVSALG